VFWFEWCTFDQLGGENSFCFFISSNFSPTCTYYLLLGNFDIREFSCLGDEVNFAFSCFVGASTPVPPKDPITFMWNPIQCIGSLQVLQNDGYEFGWNGNIACLKDFLMPRVCLGEFSSLQFRF